MTKRVFGLSLAELLSREGRDNQIPYLVETCVTLLAEKGNVQKFILFVMDVLITKGPNRGDDEGHFPNQRGHNRDGYVVRVIRGQIGTRRGFVRCIELCGCGNTEAVR